MKRFHKMIATTSVAAAAVAGAAGIAVAGNEPVPANTFVAGELPVVVPTQNNVGAKHQHSAQAFRVHIETSGAAPNADWATAKSFPIAGTELNGWTFKNGDQDCLAVPDPVVEGYAVKCGDSGEVAAGDVALVFAPAPVTGKPSVAAVLSSGAKAATISGSNKETWKLVGNVTAGKVSPGAVIEAGSRRTTVTPDKATKLAPAEK